MGNTFNTPTQLKKLTKAQEKEARMNLWKSQSTEELEKLVEHNENILATHRESIEKVEICQKELKELLKSRKQKLITDKLSGYSETEQENILVRIPHSDYCLNRKNKVAYFTGFDTEPYYDSDREIPPTILCPHCALKHLFDNPYLGIDFSLTIDCDFTYYDGGI